jgi:hypothetical protein
MAAREELVDRLSSSSTTDPSTMQTLLDAVILGIPKW